jgi:uncharacterized protein (DUF2132 family)
MFKSLQSKAKVEGAEPSTAAQSSAQPAEPQSAAPDGASPEGEGSPPTDPSSQQPTGTAPAPDKKKANPWKLLDAEKAARAKVEAEYQEFRAKIPQAAEVETLSKRASEAEALAKQLADEIRYHNYEASPEFKEKFHAPYEAAFRRAMSDLSEVAITDPQTNQPRPFTGDDLAQLAFMSFTEAKAAALRLMPDFAEDVMQARKEIRTLWDQRQTALKEWKDKGSTRQQQLADQYKKANETLSTEVRTVWEKSNSEITSHPTRGEYFKPREGDTEWNARLENGFKLADETMAVNLKDPKLSPQARAEAIKKYAIVRARAAGWGPLRYQNETLRSQVAELKKELDQYKGSTPSAGGTTTTPGRFVPSSARERIHAELAKRAH